MKTRFMGNIFEPVQGSESGEYDQTQILKTVMADMMFEIEPQNRLG